MANWVNGVVRGIELSGSRHNLEIITCMDTRNKNAHRDNLMSGLDITGKN